jgi:hypothetical protein
MALAGIAGNYTSTGDYADLGDRDGRASCSGGFVALFQL